MILMTRLENDEVVFSSTIKNLFKGGLKGYNISVSILE